MATINPCRFLLALALLSAPALGQLSFHNDPSQNSFSIKLPAFQQTFTRYFGNQPHGALLQQQPQQQAFQPQQQQQNVGALPQTYQQRQQLQQQQQQQQSGLNRYVAQFPEQPHYTVQENYINPNIRLRMQQQRLQQQQQQQQQQQLQPQQYYPQPNNYQGFSFGPSQPAQDTSGYAAAGHQQPQYEYVQQPSTAEGVNGDYQEQQQQQQQQAAGVQYQPMGLAGQRAQSAPYAQAPNNAEPGAASPNKLIGVAFSPSNEVSQVKFSSNGLKYNF